MSSIVDAKNDLVRCRLDWWIRQVADPHPGLIVARSRRLCRCLKTSRPVRAAAPQGVPKCADGIVKSMLAHSRGGSGERQQIDLDSLIEEALNLTYHGARAQFARIDLVPQDMTRVLLNLFGNGFY